MTVIIEPWPTQTHMYTPILTCTLPMCAYMHIHVSFIGIRKMLA